MRTIASVDGTAETASPGGVMHALIAVKWHPVSNVGTVAASVGVGAGEG